MNKIFKTVIDEDGFVRLPIRVYGPNGKSLKLIGIVGTQLRQKNVAVVCHSIPRGISILGHTFLKNYKALFNWKQRTFTLEEHK